jgi:hypothetical protein
VRASAGVFLEKIKKKTTVSIVAYPATIATIGHTDIPRENLKLIRNM